MRASASSESSRIGSLRVRLARRLGMVAGAALVGLLLLLAVVAGAVWRLGGQALIAPSFAETLGWAALALMVAAFGLVLVRLLMLSPPPPAGVWLAPDEAEALHYRINEVGRRMGAAPLDGVWITDEMNAAVMQRPRYGWIGPIETHLMIGLPLVHCLSRRQFLAVLAHEFGHLSMQRRGLGAIGAHLRAWWMRVLDHVSYLFPAFAGWLDAAASGNYTLRMLRLSRLEEFEADASAARLVGRGLLAEALIEVSLKDRFLREDYWPKVLAQCESSAQPSIRPFREMGLGVAAGFHEVTGMNAGFCGGAEGDAASLHPTPAERLRAMRVEAGQTATVGPSAASHYLSALLPRLAWVFDRDWWERSESAWKQAYRLSRSARRRAAREAMGKVGAFTAQVPTQMV